MRFMGGWRKEWDHRQLRYRAAMAVPDDAPLVPKRWDCPILLDQGRESTCVGCAWTAALAADPVPVAGLNYAYARNQIHSLATCLDVWSDNDRNPNEGTSTQAGAAAVVKHGYASGYAWCHSVESIARVIGHSRPVVVGSPWYETMWLMDQHGYSIPKGAVLGGHETCFLEVQPGRERFRFRTSWGSWGIWWTGEAWMSFDVVDRLLREGADACFLTGRNPEVNTPVFINF